MDVELLNLNKCSFNQGRIDGAKRINETIKRLELKLNLEILDEDPPQASVKWKTKMFLNSMLFRALSISSGICLNWNSGNGLSAVILARALMETGAVTWGMKNYILQNLKDENIEKIDKKLTIQTLAYSARFSDEDFPPPPHIMNSIREIDKAFPGLQRTYDFLSDYVHPNYTGSLSAFGKINIQKTGYIFSFDQANSEMVFSKIILGMAMLEAIEISMEDISDILESLLELEIKKPFEKNGNVKK